jgi:hypothetical protein
VSNYLQEKLSRDFITGLQTSDRFDAIMVIVDWITIYWHLEPCHTTAIAKKVIDIYYKEDLRHYDLPLHITSNPKTQFMVMFWKQFCMTLRIVVKISTTYH